MTQYRTTDARQDDQMSRLGIVQRGWNGFLRMRRMTRYSVTVVGTMLLAGLVGYPRDFEGVLVVSGIAVLAGALALSLPELAAPDRAEDRRKFVRESRHVPTVDASIALQNIDPPHLN